jgi:Flp pilus assembly protein CpaB
MSMRTILLVVLAVLCGASAAVGVSQMTQARREAAVETVPVVTATQDVPRGGVLEQASLTVQQWPKHLVPKESVSRVEDAVGRTVLFSLVKGELLLRSKITDKQTSSGFCHQDSSRRCRSGRFRLAGQSRGRTADH